MFDQILDLINQPPGSLVYHFIVLFAVEAALAISFGQWMRDREKSTARLTIGAVTIFAARSLALVASLLVWRGYLPRNVLLPPIERAVDTLTILAVAWVFTTMDDPDILNRNFLPDVMAAVLSGMMIAGFIGTYYYWFFAASRGQLFNGLWLDILWAGAQIIIALAGLIWMLARSRYVFDPFLKGILLVVLGAASVIHLVQTPLGDVASMARIGQLLAMPMFSAVAYRHVIEKLLHWDAFRPERVDSAIQADAAAPVVPVAPLAQPAPVPPAASALKGEETVAGERSRPSNLPPVVDIIEAIGGLLSTLDQAGIIREVTRSVATALRADVVALTVVDEESQQAGILGGYDNISQAHLPQAVLDLGAHPTIVNTLGRLRQMRLTTQRNLRELKDLYSKLGITHQGPAYMQPLVDKDDRIGVLIVGSPYSERLLSNEERNLLDRLGPLVTSALVNAEAYQDAREEGEKAAVEEGARIANLADDLTATTAELNDARRQMDEMKAYIRDMHRQLDGMRGQSETDQRQIEALQAIASETDTLRGELERLKTNGGSDSGAFKQAQAEIQRLREDNERLLQRVLQQKHEVEQARQQPGPRGDGGFSMSIEPTSLQRELEEMRLALQSELVSMRARLTQASIGQQEVTFLQEQLSAKARETVVLQARLVESTAIIEALRDQIGSIKAGGQGLEAFQARIAAQAKELEDLRGELDRARAAVKPESIRAQQDMDKFDRESTGQFQALLSDRSQMIEMLEAQLSEKNRAITELAGHMSDVEKSLRNLERQLSHKTDEIVALQASLTEARAQAQEQIASLQAEGSSGDAAHAQAQALEAQLAEKAQAVEVLEAQLQSAKESIASFEQQLSETNQAVNAAITGARQGDSHDEVIASIAQEIRTPMSSIMGYTELLLREQVGIIGSLQRKFLQRVKANTERMGVLLEDLIRITALDTGRMQLESEKVDVVYAVEETVMNVANQYREKGLTLRLTLADGLPSITADRDALLQIIGHLLTNAALASPVEGEVELTATTRRDSLTPAGGEEVTANCLYLAVQDSGGGVAEEDYERVFMRKYRADNPLIEGLGDTGVSLSLAKALIDAHNGRIWLDSVREKGTTFHVLLPLTPLKTGSAEA